MSIGGGDGVGVEEIGWGKERRERNRGRRGVFLPYLGQQLGEMLHEDLKCGPAEGQVTAAGVWLHGVACRLVGILGAQRKFSLALLCYPGAWAQRQVTEVGS